MPVPPSYTVTDLVAPQGFDADGVMPNVVGINAAGQVAANYLLPPFQSFAYFYSGGVWTNIQALSGANQTTAINIGASATGFSTASSGFPHAFRSLGLSQDLGTLPGDVRSFGTAINENSQVVGYSCGDPCTVYHPFIYDERGLLGLPIASGSRPNPTGITLPEVTGLFCVAGYNDNQIVFLFANPDQTKNIGTHGPGTTSGGVNNFVDIVGSSNSGPFWIQYAQLDGAALMDLPLPPGSYSGGLAFKINDYRQIVGSALLGSEKRAIMYAGDHLQLCSLAVDLNSRIAGGSPFILLESANGINNAGQITGVGKVSANRRHVFLLTPSQSAANQATQTSLAGIIGLTLRTAGLGAGLFGTALAIIRQTRGDPRFLVLLALVGQLAEHLLEVLTVENGFDAPFDYRFCLAPASQPPTFPTIDDDPSLPPGLATAANMASGNAAQAIGYAQAIRMTLNRLQGAFLMGDQDRINIQQQALNNFLTSTGTALGQYAAGLRDMMNRIAGSSIDETLSAGDIAQFQMALNAQGYAALPQDERDLFTQVGLGAADFSLILNALLNVPPASAAGLWSDSLTRLANWMDQIAGLYSGV